MDDFKWATEYTKTPGCKISGTVNRILSVSDEDRILQDYTYNWYKEKYGYDTCDEGNWHESYGGYKIINKDVIMVETLYHEQYEGTQSLVRYINIHTDEEVNSRDIIR